MTICMAIIALVAACVTQPEKINNNMIEKEFVGLDEGCEVFFPDGRTFRKTSEGIIEVKAA